ncbi:MAG: V-type ATP synthase subunit A [gamma proteobacterium symbiont of Taylorina sp.]|nr:V-type ATP synthase subunit A [gamma proteobacterium symbiont of Taylorina sp.]
MDGKLVQINGPLVRAELDKARIGEQVHLGKLNLTGEVIGREGKIALIQVYEDTESLILGEKVTALGYPLSVELGPGLIGQIFDGVQRPLQELAQLSGDYIPRGISVPALKHDIKWHFKPNADLTAGMLLNGGQSLGSVPETKLITHQILIPPDRQGELLWLAESGSYTLDEPIARIKDNQDLEKSLYLSHYWPVRTPRPYDHREDAIAPLITGQRIFDTFFPLLKGGKATIPGPFGAGKTMIQQQIARWSDADIVIYVGCGERGNELVDVLETFPKIIDPRSKRSLMERTILVANTSNMPVVAREASIYVGVTLAEYYRDQGMDVVMVADSTSRWAEALREVAGRLGQMPVEEGYPAYLASRLAAFYERSGRVNTLCGKQGSVTLIGAVSPPGGDFSEPVTGHTKEIVQTFWALSKELADARHYPSVSWTESFSEYVAITADWWAQNIHPDWYKLRSEALSLLSQAHELIRIVNLVGPEALSAEQRWILSGADLIKEGVLQQSALDEVDSYSSPEKQFLLLQIMLIIYHKGEALLTLGMPVQELNQLPLLIKAKRCKSTYSSEQIEDLKQFIVQIEHDFQHYYNEYQQ